MCILSQFSEIRSILKLDHFVNQLLRIFEDNVFNCYRFSSASTWYWEHWPIIMNNDDIHVRSDTPVVENRVI